MTDDKATNANLLVSQNELIIERNGVAIWGGQIVEVHKVADETTKKVRVYAKGFASLLDYRVTQLTVDYIDTDAGTIAWGLINHTQTAGSYGDFGITEGTIESTVKRTREYPQYTNILRSIQELSDSLGGFDYEVTPDKVFNVYRSMGGGDYNLFALDTDNNKILKYSGFSNTVLDSFSTPSTQPLALGIGYIDVYSTDTNTDKVYWHDGFSATIKDSLSLANRTGATLAQGDLYTDDGSTIYKHSGFSTTVEESYVSSITKISYGGGYFVGLIGGATDELYKISIVGDALTVDSTIIAPANDPSGVCFDGGDLFSADATTNTVYHHTGFTTTVEDSFAAGLTINGLAYYQYGIKPNIVFTRPGNIRAIEQTEQGEIFNWVGALGKDLGQNLLLALKEDFDSEATYGRREAFVSYKSLDHSTESSKAQIFLEDLAQAEVDLRKVPMNLVTRLSVNPQMRPYLFSEYQLGDMVKVEISESSFSVDDYYRIDIISVSIDDEDVENVTLTVEKL